MKLTVRRATPPPPPPPPEIKEVVLTMSKQEADLLLAMFEAGFHEATSWKEMKARYRNRHGHDPLYFGEFITKVKESLTKELINES